MSKLLLFINAFYLGLGSFFSFYVAPTLFKVLEKGQAGKVVEKVFPIYFAIGLIVALISLLLSFNISRLLFILFLINLLILALLEFYVLPLSHSLKETNYQAFMRWHGISMGLNLISLVLFFISCVILMRE